MRLFDPQPILDRLSEVSTGPWSRHGANVHDQHGVLFTGRDTSAAARAQADRDAEFVAHARADITALLEHVAFLQRQVEENPRGRHRASD